jgi:hexosaminidase
MIRSDYDNSHDANVYLADQITANITARTVYGARNGLETLRQLMTAYGRPKFNGKTLVMAAEAQIVDEPVYAHRGFMLDTSRNYFPLAAIRRTIDAMGHSKLNVFHWHATDSHSFPLDLPSAPKMAR